MYTVPSSKDNETIPVPTSLRDSLSCLDVVWADMFETEDINPDTARQKQIDFLRGAPPRWQNFCTSVNEPTVVPLVERDGFKDLIQLIETRKRKGALITDVSLRYQPGSGGSTLAMQVLWHFRKDLRCARAIDSDLNNKLSDLSKQVLDLFLLSNEEHANQDRRTVLLLLDTREKIVLCKNLIEHIHKRGINTDFPVVIILNCIPTDFTLNDTMILPPEPSEEATKHFKDKILQQIRLQTKSQRRITIINLHRKESGISQLDSKGLSDLGEELTLIEPFQKDISAKEFEKTLLHKKKKHLNTVPLLYDYKDDKSLRCLITNLLDCKDCPKFIIINTVNKSAVRVPDDVKLKMELLPDEKERFAQKLQELENENKEMCQKLHAFNIMQRGFQKEEAEKMITEEMVNHIEKDPKSSETTLLSILALINSCVPGSHLSKLLCERFIDQSEWPTDEGKPSLEMILKPFEDLIVIFSDGEQKADCIRLAHPMIADACLKRLTKDKVTKYDIAHKFLKEMVKSNEHAQICKTMLVTRPWGLIEKEQFSKLVLDEGENNTKQYIKLLKSASFLFSTDPLYPQALARLYYIKVKEENKFDNAIKKATEAIGRDKKNSHIKNTLSRALRYQLKCELNSIPSRNKNLCLAIAKSAIDACNAEAEAAEAEVELQDNKTQFNYRGHFGFLQVCNDVYKAECLSDVKKDVESKYNFLEWFLAFSKPSFDEEEPDYFCKDVEECYMRYFTQVEQTGEMTQNKKKKKTLNEKKKQTFAGLLHFLKSDINVLEEYWNAIKKSQSNNEEHIVPNVLANIILSQFDKPCENLQDLQTRLQELWKTEEKHRSPEFYLLILLLFWPDEAQPVNQDSPNLENCVQYMSQSYERKYQKYLYGRYLVPLFFLGKGSGLQRLVHKKLHHTDLELLTEEDENVEVRCLQRINGEVKKHEVFAVRDGQKIQVTPYKPASVYREGEVSFYLGFTIKGPVAYNIRYDETS